MPLKIINATEIKEGTTFTYQGKHYITKKIDKSTTGRHGHAKCRIEAKEIASGKKIISVFPGHERFEIPFIEKKRGQVLSSSGDNANIMDSKSFETFDVKVDDELVGKLGGGEEVEYWDIEGEKIIKKIL